MGFVPFGIATCGRLHCRVAAVLLLNAIHFLLIEEPQLESRFGDDYRLYTRHVPRFIPRIRPWNGA